MSPRPANRCEAAMSASGAEERRLLVLAGRASRSSSCTSANDGSEGDAGEPPLHTQQAGAAKPGAGQPHPQEQAPQQQPQPQHRGLFSGLLAGGGGGAGEHQKAANYQQQATYQYHQNSASPSLASRLSGGSRRFRQLLQSLPAPLLAGGCCFSVLVILGVLLMAAECKPLDERAAAAAANGDPYAASALEQLEAAPGLLVGGAERAEGLVTLDESAPGAGLLLRDERHLEAASEREPAAAAAAAAAAQRGQRSRLALKRELLAELMQPASAAAAAISTRRHQAHQQAHPHQAHQQEAPPADRQEAALVADALEGARDSDGEPETPAGRPASLRSSRLELEPDQLRHEPLFSQPPNRLAAAAAAVAAADQQHRHRQHQHQPSLFQQPLRAPPAPNHHQSPAQSPMQSQIQQQLQQQQHQTNSIRDQQQTDQQQLHHDRPYDVAQIQCNNTEEGFERFACPTPDELGRYWCIEDRLFCDGFYHCPGGEDEERVACMYYKLFISHIDILTNTFLTWIKKQNRHSSGLAGHRFDAGAASVVAPS